MLPSDTGALLQCQKNGWRNHHLRSHEDNLRIFFDLLPLLLIRKNRMLSRRERIHSDVKRAKLQRERLGQSFKAELRSAIRQSSGHSSLATAGGDIDDASTSAFTNER